MGKINDAVHALFIEFADSGVDFKDFNHDDLKRVKEIVKDKEYIVWINDHINRLPVYINDAGRDYYFGLESNDLNGNGFETYTSMVNPLHFDNFQKSKSFWDNHPMGINNTTYHVKTKLNNWKWTHSSSKALNFTNDGRAQFVLSVVHDIEKLLFGDYHPTSDRFYKQKLDRFNRLTKREKEVLDLIVSEKTSHEIASELFVEPSTIESHRKNIKKKLEIKNSLGMMKYFLLFSNEV